MSDKELLELAAKAAGFTNLTYCPAWKCMAEFDIDKQGGYFKWDTYWNPLKDDSDALRLAVELKIDIHQRVAEPHVAAIAAMQSPKIESVVDEKQRLAATRRAIVRAAASSIEGKL